MSDQHDQPHPDVEEWFRIRQNRLKATTTATPRDSQTSGWMERPDPEDRAEERWAVSQSRHDLRIRSDSNVAMMAHGDLLSVRTSDAHHMRIHMGGRPGWGSFVHVGAPGA